MFFMKKVLKTLISSFLITGIVFSTALATEVKEVTEQAAVQEQNIVSEGNIISDKTAVKSEAIYSKDGSNINVEINSMPGSENFVEAGCTIARIGTGLVQISGWSEAPTAVDSLGYVLYVEKLQSGSWVTIKTYTLTLNNTDEAIGFYSLSVTPNNFYRVRGVHSLTNNGVTSYTTSATAMYYM